MVYTYKHTSFNDAKAPYAQIKQSLRDDLFAGKWLPGALMPSEAELVTRFGVSRMTVNRALRELQAEGLIERVQGVGTFAAHPHRVVSTLSIRDLHEEIEGRGHAHHSTVHLLASEAVTPALALQLGLVVGSTVFHSLMTHFEDGVALQLEDRYVNPSCAPDYLEQDFTRITPTRYLLQVLPYGEASYRLEASNATPQEAEFLHIQTGAACLVVVRRTTLIQLQNNVRQVEGITLVRLLHPGSLYSLQGQF